ncbi:MAG: hypothetical protein K5990_01435 [Oscillospiraceae bacterium]|nr:hypothetical protein [Oscillospiraceae bacterium]
MIFLDLIDGKKLRRTAYNLLFLVGALWLQFSVLARLEILGTRIFLLPAAVVAVGMWEGGVRGGVLGALAGLGCDLAMTESTVTFLILFSIYGFAAGVLADYLVNRGILSCLILSALALLLTALVQILPLWVFHGVGLDELLPYVLLQTLWSLPFAVPAFYLCRAIGGKQIEN